MASFRDIKRKSRIDLHRHMQVPAMYYAPNPSTPGSFLDPVLISVRLHLKDKMLGDMPGTNFNYAERAEPIPRILFLRVQVEKPVRNAIVSIEEGEAYRVDFIEPPDDISVTAHVKRLTAAEAAGLATPVGALPALEYPAPTIPVWTGTPVNFPDGLSLSFQNDLALAQRVDFISDDVAYVGYAEPGSLTSSPAWRIKKVTFAGDDVTIQWADGTDDYIKVWDNRSSYAYT